MKIMSINGVNFELQKEVISLPVVERIIGNEE